MLRELNIKNFALVEDMNISFEPGLNVILGETGSGKSNIIDSLSILLGDRAQKDKIRQGTNRAYISAAFDIDDNEEVIKKLKERSIEVCDEPLIISKEISLNSSSVTRINNIISPASFVKELAEHLIDIYGQFENINILSKSMQRNFIDSFANYKHQEDLLEFKNSYENYLKLQRDLENFSKSPEEIGRDLDFLKFQIDEINNSNVLSINEEELEAKLTLIENSQELKENASKILNLLDYDDESILTNLGRTISFSEKIESRDENFLELRERLNRSYIEIEDIKYEISSYFESLDFDEAEYKDLDNKRSILFEMKRKYGNSIHDIKSYLEDALQKVNQIENYEKIIEDKKNKLNNIEMDLVKSAQIISKTRKDIANKLKEQIETQLQELEMKDSKFEVDFKEIPLSRDGIDEITFYISFNINEPLKELSTVASGGEISRFMLAVKSIEANVDEIPTLIFDEIDSGISGNAGNIVGKKLKNLSNSHQLLCISHLPQIISKGDNLFLVYKEVDNGKMTSKIKKLTYEEKIQSLAKIIEGDNYSNHTYLTAKKMIDDNLRGAK
ncbi:DNA repair protein RecN [Neofamilia massiliensis]|uniref:DNA repair protein RecN n=1 Tax=Neofamilia massiliensis TaxID=1673724 RepID=UPI0006BB94ED|nr:DNA repair protein RecN [Neofamilia massiliensis]